MNELQVAFNTYSISDNDELSRVIKLNMPTFFNHDEIEDYLLFLNSQRQFYFTVYNEKNEVVGGFGYSLFSSQGYAKIDWIFFDPKIHGQRVGSEAVRFCEAHIFPHKINPCRLSPLHQQCAYLLLHHPSFLFSI